MLAWAVAASFPWSAWIWMIFSSFSLSSSKTPVFCSTHLVWHCGVVENVSIIRYKIYDTSLYLQIFTRIDILQLLSFQIFQSVLGDGKLLGTLHNRFEHLTPVGLHHDAPDQRAHGHDYQELGHFDCTNCTVDHWEPDKQLLVWQFQSFAYIHICSVSHTYAPVGTRAFAVKS